MYPDYIIKNQDFLQKICRTKSNKRRTKLLQAASDDQLLAIVDICHNIIKGNLNIKNSKRKKLALTGDYYRAISRSRSPRTTLHRIQSGGNIGLIGAIIAPVLGALAQNLLDKALNKYEER
jgi:hypothetical protein